MKVLIYSANFWPEPVGIGKYSGEMAHWLADQGHEVRVVAAPPYYPNWRVRAGYRWPPYQRERLPDFTIWRAPLWVPGNPNGLTRILHLLSFAIAAFPSMLCQALWRPDLVITVAPALLCAPGGWCVARLCGAKAWLHVQDFEIDVAFRLGLLKSKLLQWLALRLESWMLRRFDHVSSISHRMVDRLVTKGVAPERTRFFPNWVDTSHIGPACSGAGYRRELGIAPQTIVVLFSGTLGAKHGLLMIPQVATLLADRRDILFVICGEGALKKELESRTRELPNVRLLPLQPSERLGELLTMADIHLLPQNSDAADLVLPSKLSGMLASGRPIVATCTAGTELATVVSQCGLVTTPGDPEQLRSAILQLADNPASMAELGQRARTWAEGHLQRDAILGRVFASLQESATRAEAILPVESPAEQPVPISE